MKLSIIIPTYNRKEILLKTLKSIEQQTFPKKNFEVILVDDGSTDNTEETIKNNKFSFNLKYLKQKNQGQGVARNTALKHAKGKVVAFIGDDIILTKDWIKQHLDIHYKNSNIAVLGLTLWHPEIKQTTFMKYLAPNGPQFNYGLIKDNKADFKFFWTSNISLEKKWFNIEKFDENFNKWGYEDIELGYRLQKKGLKIVYNKDALAYHYHIYNNPEEFLKKYIDAAKMALYFAEKHPELKEFLIDTNKLKKRYILPLLILQILPFKTKKLKILYWKLKRRYYFSKGLSQSLKTKN